MAKMAMKDWTPTARPSADLKRITRRKVAGPSHLKLTRLVLACSTEDQNKIKMLLANLGECLPAAVMAGCMALSEELRVRIQMDSVLVSVSMLRLSTNHSNDLVRP